MQVVQHGITYDINTVSHADDRTFQTLMIESDTEGLILFQDTVETLTGHSVEIIDGMAKASRDDVAEWLAFEVREYL